MTTSLPIKVHVLYESSNGAEPHGCSVIRLLRPLSHPSVTDLIELSFSTKIPEHSVDVVIIERLWVHQFNTLELLDQLRNLKDRGVKIIYETDDDLLNVHARPGDREWPSYHQKNIIRLFARESDGIIVSTENLAKTFTPMNANVHVFENNLDEALFPRRRKLKDGKKVKFGYMGTFTHLEDLIYISTAIKKVLANFSNAEFEIVGIGDEKTIRDIFGSAAVSIKRVPDRDVPYERFCSWMAENLLWDFGIAPLLESVFTDSKSDIKFIDYSLLGIPGIYSDVPAYAGTVKHDNNGLLSKNTTDDWDANLSKMMSSYALRSRLADTAFEYASEHRVLRQKAVHLANIITTIVNH